MSKSVRLSTQRRAAPAATKKSAISASAGATKRPGGARSARPCRPAPAHRRPPAGRRAGPAASAASRGCGRRRRRARASAVVERSRRRGSPPRRALPISVAICSHSGTLGGGARAASCVAEGARVRRRRRARRVAPSAARARRQVAGERGRSAACCAGSREELDQLPGRVRLRASRGTAPGSTPPASETPGQSASAGRRQRRGRPARLQLGRQAAAELAEVPRAR